VTFVSRRAEEAHWVRALGLGRRTSVVRDLRDLGRDRLQANRTTLPVEVATGGTVHARGRVLAAGPVRSLPLNRRFRLS
jgi:urease alpha subunit